LNFNSNSGFKVPLFKGDLGGFLPTLVQTNNPSYAFCLH
jgi:hypothetical protein